MIAAVLAQGSALEPATAATYGAAEFWVFWILAPLALGAGVSMVLLRNPVHAALMLVANFFVMALLFAVLEAQFLATVQIIVYAGAIMVLFLFVIMLLGVDVDQEAGKDLPGQRPAAIILGAVLLGALVVGVVQPFLGPAAACNAPPPPTAAGGICQGLAGINGAPGGNPRGIGALLFTDYVWPFEVSTVLLLIAAVGAIVLGRKHDRPEDLAERTATEAEAEEAAR
jgi:NADH-quinone oxidoreductase subunit J